VERVSLFIKKLVAAVYKKEVSQFEHGCLAAPHPTGIVLVRDFVAQQPDFLPDVVLIEEAEYHPRGESLPEVQNGFEEDGVVNAHPTAHCVRCFRRRKLASPRHSSGAFALDRIPGREV
jgi:hypothetical protein